MQKAWQAWSFVDFGQKHSVQDGRAEGGGRCEGLRLRGVWRNSGGRFSARGDRWRLVNRGKRVLSRLTLKSYRVPKP